MTIPSYERRSFSETAVATTITADISDVDMSISIASATGWPNGAAGDFYVRIENETIRIDTRTTTTLTVLSDGRGANGTTAANHSSGTAITVVYSAFDADEANYAVAETVGKVTAAGQLLVGDGTNSLAALANGTSGLPLVAGASTPSYTTLGSSALAADSVGSSQIAANAVGASEIAADAVSTSELANDAVETANILDANVTAAKLGAQAVTEAKLHTSVAGAGLAGGNGTALSVNVDASTIEINSDTLRVKDAGITGAKLATSVADASTIEVNSSALRLKDAGITSAKFNSEAATSWTPTVGGGTWALGSGSVAGIYIKHGRMVWVQGIITFGAGLNSGGGSSLVIGGLPVAMNATVGASGRVFINDASSSTNFLADWQVGTSASSGTVYTSGLFSTPGVVFRTAVINTNPMAWASGDSITVQLFYIAAS